MAGTRRELPTPLPRPAFVDPLPGTWLYLGLRADLRTLGPRVRASAERARVIARCHAVLDRLGSGATVLEAVLIPPISGVPRFDVVVLARSGDRAELDAVRAGISDDGLPVVATMTGRNVRRFGDTESTRHGTFLLNHFTAPDADTAQSAWEDIAGWYAGPLGVDNSTLLRLDRGAPYALVNYVRTPGPPVPFLLRQLATPSYYTQVRARLRAHDTEFLPLLLRPTGRTT